MLKCLHTVILVTQPKKIFLLNAVLEQLYVKISVSPRGAVILAVSQEIEYARVFPTAERSGIIQKQTTVWGREKMLFFFFGVLKLAYLVIMIPYIINYPCIHKQGG